jgi:hypothetical protein
MTEYASEDVMTEIARLRALLDAVCPALSSITSRMTSAATDFGAYEPDSWVYGIAVGWDCEEDHDHDDLCGGTGAMDELIACHGWDETAVARLRELREAYAAAVRQ